MVLLGLVLLAACAALAVEVAISNTDTATFEAFTQSFTDDFSVGGLFLVGLATGALAVLAVWMIMAGLRRARSRRHETKAVVTETRSRVDELEEENEELRTELDRERERVATVRSHATSAPAGERDTVLTRDRDGDGVADRSERVVDLSDRDGSVGSRAVYPDDPTRTTEDTPAYDETAETSTHRGLLGRRRDR